MKVTYNWLKEFVDVKISPKALAEKLTMAGLEVTSLEEKAGDFIFEIEVTSNRPDWLSVIGIAREVAAITNLKFKIKNLKSQFKIKKENISLGIRIENKKDCPLYTAKIIKDVKVGPSPEWLKKRLESVGCRSVNNIVDITNYILFEYGEPLHAFDLEKLSNDAIIVRRAKIGEKIVTINAEEKALSPEILVIADKDRSVAIAGIMGGQDTEVSASTKNILLEAAIFNPVIVRRSRQKLGLQSESAYRFERGIDPEIVEIGSRRVEELIRELAGGRCVLAASSGTTRARAKSIGLDIGRVQKILGVNITAIKVKQILERLGFEVRKKAKDNFTVGVPARRLDVNLEVDLIEEISRIWGYAFIPQSLPQVKPQLSESTTRDLVSLVKNTLVGLGLNEAITYSLMDAELLPDFMSEEGASAIEISNPLSKEQGILRPTLLPGLANCIAYNLNQKQDYVNIFEAARVFLVSGSGPKEELRLGIASCGAKTTLLEQGLIKDMAGFLHLKGILDALFGRLGISDYNLRQENAFEAGIYIGKERAGLMFRPRQQVLAKLDIKNKDVFMLELSLDKAFSCAQLKKQFTALPKYPGIVRDISFILKEEVSVKEILEALQEKGRSLLSEVKVVDYYKGKQIPAGYRGLTISCFYRSGERTLIDAEVSPVHELLSNTLTQRFGAKIR